MLIFGDIFWGHSPRPPSGRGYGAPPQTSPPRGHPDCQVLRAPRYLNPALLQADAKQVIVYVIVKLV